MLTFHASMPVLSPAALRRLSLLDSVLLVVMGAAAAWLYGPVSPDGSILPASLVFTGGILSARLAAGTVLHRWGHRRALPFIPRRQWIAAWWRSMGLAPIAVFAAGTSLGLVQVVVSSPFWAMPLRHWAGAVALALLMLFVANGERGRSKVVG